MQPINRCNPIKIRQTKDYGLYAVMHLMTFTMSVDEIDRLRAHVIVFELGLFGIPYAIIHVYF